ncbi:MAG: hypothetical protein J7L95_02755 [Prolixibacteraceae bacterium]|nr:hypothetical protein [Prolixibacteraceae bacterium]
MASLHYPANIGGIKAVESLLPKVRQVEVSDTGFHQTLPPKFFCTGIR